MTPRYKHYEDLMKGRIDRRTFFKRAAAAELRLLSSKTGFHNRRRRVIFLRVTITSR
jgi:hypothetical protein